MPVNVGAPNAFNFGKDAVFTIIGPLGILNYPVTQGEYKQQTKPVESRPLNSPPIYAEIPDGWSGSFSFDRVGRQLDDLFAQMEQSYWASGQLFNFSVTETIQEVDGSISQYRFQNMAVKLESGGIFKGDGKVDMKLSFRCSRRMLVQ
ncbi:MAG TPA: hypothetical protein VM689_20615 [Aliidongia sp.]|nr:hypothetical protein [Aliidongia sp.]